MISVCISVTVHSVLTVTSELVMLSLDLVKTRLSVMSMEMRKNFIQVILTSLIEKSPDPKILRAVVKIVEEWVKNNSPMAANQVRELFPLCHFRSCTLSIVTKMFRDLGKFNKDIANQRFNSERKPGKKCEIFEQTIIKAHL